MSYRNVQEKIAAFIRKTGEKNVACYRMAITTPEDFREAFQLDLGTLKTIRHWVISPRRIANSRTDVPAGQEYQIYEFLLQGFASRTNEKGTQDFWRAVERLADAFAQEITLGDSVECTEPVEFTVGDVQPLGPVLCDYATGSIVCRQRKNVKYR